MLPACKKGLSIMENINNAQWSNNKTKLIVIKSKGNSGKTTTIWMTLFELVNQGAKIINLRHVDSYVTFTLPASIPPAGQRFDFVAELEWYRLRIVLLSHGDLASVVQKELDAILQTNPDFVICAARSQWRTNSTWELFETRYTNIHFNRICLWSEFSNHKADEFAVKDPTVTAIVKYIKP